MAGSLELLCRHLPYQLLSCEAQKWCVCSSEESLANISTRLRDALKPSIESSWTDQDSYAARKNPNLIKQ